MRLLRRWARRVIAMCGCSLRIRGLQHLEGGALRRHRRQPRELSRFRRAAGRDPVRLPLRGESRRTRQAVCRTRAPQGAPPDRGSALDPFARGVHPGDAHERWTTARRSSSSPKAPAPPISCRHSKMGRFARPSRVAGRSFRWSLLARHTFCRDNSDCFAAALSRSIFFRRFIPRACRGMRPRFVNRPGQRSLVSSRLMIRKRFLGPLRTGSPGSCGSCGGL